MLVRAGVLFALAAAVSLVAAFVFRRRTTTLRPDEIHLRPLAGASKRIKLAGATGRIELVVLQQGPVPFKLGITLHLQSNDAPDLQLHAEHLIAESRPRPESRSPAFREDDIAFWAIEHFGCTATLLASVDAWVKQRG